jgi:Rieske Fe-S protein
MEITRRDMMVMAGAVAAGCCAGCMGPSLLDKAPETVDAGPTNQWASAGVDGKFRDQYGFYLISNGSRVYAQSAICTHRGCKIDSGKEGFECPCHGSKFGLDGHVVEGPASKPLVRLAMEVDGSGHLIVHPHKKLGPEEFETPGAFAAVKA